MSSPDIAQVRAAGVDLTEPGGIGEPRHDVAQRADGGTGSGCRGRAGRIRGVSTGVAAPASSSDHTSSPKTDEVSLGRADEGAPVLALEQNVAGIEVAQPHAPFAFGAGRKHDARAVVEIEADVLRADLRRRLGRRGDMASSSRRTLLSRGQRGSGRRGRRSPPDRPSRSRLRGPRSRRPLFHPSDSLTYLGLGSRSCGMPGRSNWSRIPRSPLSSATCSSRHAPQAAGTKRTSMRHRITGTLRRNSIGRASATRLAGSCNAFVKQLRRKKRWR